jgi:ParB-like chromosome segregation protein Spo0J
MSPIIHCKFDEMVSIINLKEHPKNRNKHGDDQIARLAKLYSHHGIRHPIIISKRSGYMVAGHGRRLAAIRAGLKEFPVVYQSFDSDELEYAFVQADNAIAKWAELDLEEIKVDITDFSDEFDLELLGIKKLKFNDEIENIEQKLIFEVVVTCENEQNQEEIYNQLTEMGLSCRVLSM